MRFEPRILGILCNWCAYAGADLAGVSRFQYPPNMRVIRVMCAGRVDPVFILEAFRKKCDAVLIGGCHPGECHYQSGNCEVMNTVNAVRMLLAHIPINPERLLLEWISAGEGARFAKVITDFTARVRELGPLGRDAKNSIELQKSKIETATHVAAGERLRRAMAKQSIMMRKQNGLNPEPLSKQIDESLNKVILEEMSAYEHPVHWGETVS